MLTKRAFFAAAAAAAALALGGAALAMKIDGFLKVPDIPGESRSAGHDGWIEVTSVAFSKGQRGVRPASTGEGVLRVTVKRGAHSDALERAARAETKFPAITLSVPDSAARGGYLQIKMEDVLVSSYQRGAARGDILEEEVAFAYKTITFN